MDESSDSGGDMHSEEESEGGDESEMDLDDILGSMDDDSGDDDYDEYDDNQEGVSIIYYYHRN